MAPSLFRAAGSMMVVALLGCGPGDGGPGGYVLLDPDAAEAGWSIEVDGRVRRAGWPVRMSAEERASLVGDDRAQPLAVEAGSLLRVRGARAQLEPSWADGARLVLHADVDAARELTAMWGAALQPIALAATPSWLLEGPELLELVALSDEPDESVTVEVAEEEAGRVEQEQSPEGVVAHGAPRRDASPLGMVERFLLAEDIERDLAVVLQLPGPRVFEVGEHIPVSATLVNRSADSVRWVVAPGDGSAGGWREPEVFLTAERASGDGWVSVPERESQRFCGNFEEDWDRSVLALLPGDSMRLHHFDAPEDRLDLAEPGSVLLRAHYRYGAGEHTLSRPMRIGNEWFYGGELPRSVPAELSDVPAFEVVSEPVQVWIVRPMELAVTLRGDLRRGEATPFASVIDVAVVNTTQSEVEIAGAPGGFYEGFRSFFVEALPASAVRVTMPEDSTAATPPPMRLGPGERRSLGEQLPTTIELLDGTSVRLRFGLNYHRSSGSPQDERTRRELRSDWIEVRAAP